MTGFQIRDAQGNALSMKVLDAEAAAFWGREVHPKWYASPKPTGYDEMSDIDKIRADCGNNWFDAIGWYIAKQGTWTSGWNNVINTMCAESIGQAALTREFVIPDKFEWNDDFITLSQEIQLSIAAVMEYYRPYVALIKHWESKGYTPHRIE